MANHVELRVHGVSGTSAEALLGVSRDQLAWPPPAGDRLVRFERPARSRPGRGALEGMSWGRLTSGAVTQALWLMLLPFALVNLGYWARPWDDEDPAPGERATPPQTRRAAATAWFWERGVEPAGVLHRGLVRLVALGLTAAIAWASAALTLDVVAWQCWVRRTAACTDVPGWLGWVEAGRGWSVTAALAAGLLGPLAVVVGLALLSARASVRYEAFRVEYRNGNGHRDPDLFSPRMWSGDAMVSRLRELHLVTGLLTLGAVALLLGPDSWLRTTGLVLELIGVLAVVALVVDPRVMVWRDDQPLGRTGRWLVWAAAGLALGLGVWTLPRADSALPDSPYAPGLASVGYVLVLSELCLLVALLALHGSVRLLLGARFGRPAVTCADGRALDVAAGGMASWLLTTLSVTAGFTISACVATQSARMLGARALPVFDIAAAATGVFAVLLVPVGLVAWRRYAGKRRDAEAAVLDDYADELAEMFPAGVRAGDHRVRRVVGPRALAQVVSFDLARGVVILSSVVGVFASVYASGNAVLGLVSRNTPGAVSRALTPYLHVLQPLGSWLVTGVGFALIAAGAAAWRSEKARRLVGIAWDVASFWPRAAHPLAPPCYAERAVPQLACRVSHLAGPARRERVVLAGHSQGSVLAVAALAQLHGRPPHGTPEGRGALNRVALLTLGSPLMRLYAPVFPRLFWPSELAILRARLDGRWTNLWRPTDPIGGPLQPLLGATTAGGVPGDVRLDDPVQLSILDSKACYPPVHGHVRYSDDPGYQRSVDALARHLASSSLPPVTDRTGVPQRVAGSDGSTRSATPVRSGARAR